MESNVVQARAGSNGAGTLFTAAKTGNTRRASAWLESRLAQMRAKGLFSELVTITPEIAEMLLARNPDNRHRSPDVVNRYASDMRSGRWSLTGESLKISTDGLLNDGQPRIRA